MFSIGYAGVRKSPANYGLLGLERHAVMAYDGHIFQPWCCLAVMPEPGLGMRGHENLSVVCHPKT